jgi:hypothetical protein
LRPPGSQGSVIAAPKDSPLPRTDLVTYALSAVARKALEEYLARRREAS